MSRLRHRTHGPICVRQLVLKGKTSGKPHHQLFGLRRSASLLNGESEAIRIRYLGEAYVCISVPHKKRLTRLAVEEREMAGKDSTKTICFMLSRKGTHTTQLGRTPNLCDGMNNAPIVEQRSAAGHLFRVNANLCT